MEYPLCFRIVEEKVKPERITNNRKERREKWWQYAEKALALYRTISGMDRVIAIAATSRTLAFTFSSPNIVFSHATYVIAMSRGSEFALLQSAAHETWARHQASSMKGDLRYTPSDCFETFPFPVDLARVDAVGERYHDHRSKIMRSNNEGLTKTYNHFHDPDEKRDDFQHLRELHVEMDQAVAIAYGWTDFDLDHGFHDTKQGVRFTISEAARREVLQRLLKLNHERYAEEEKQGLHGKKGTAKRTAAKKTTSKPAKEESTLFDMEEDEE